MPESEQSEPAEDDADLVAEGGDVSDSELPGASAAVDEHGHVPVLPAQVLELLDLKPGQVVLDCTLGRGGHASLILEKISPGGHYIGLDVDPANAQYAQKRLENQAKTLNVKLDIRNVNFTLTGQVLADLKLNGVDRLLADLGFASNQMSDPARGFSFSKDGPLDMRLDPELTESAADLVNELPETELANVIYRYGEERLSRKIARKIADARHKAPIQTTSELATLVREAYGFRGQPRGQSHEPRKPMWFGKSRIDPATRTFMALRIAVNAELQALEQLIAGLEHWLRPNAIAALISFHSLEDRIVKRAFVDLQRRELGRRLTTKPLIADEAECAKNPRSRSAKLRGLEWYGPQDVRLNPKSAAPEPPDHRGFSSV